MSVGGEPGSCEDDAASALLATPAVDDALVPAPSSSPSQLALKEEDLERLSDCLVRPSSHEAVSHSGALPPTSVQSPSMALSSHLVLSVGQLEAGDAGGAGIR